MKKTIFKFLNFKSLNFFRMKNITLLWIVVFCVSCSSPKFFTSDVKPYEIKEMIKFEPLSFISLIERWNSGVYDDSISYDAQIALNESLNAFSGVLRLSSDEILMLDDFERNEFEQEINILISMAERNKKKYNIPITPLIESLLDEYDMRFGLIILQDGFTRTKRNYNRQIAFSIGLGVLTGISSGVSTYQSPVKASSTLYAIIVDNKEKNVTFFNKSVLQNKEPTDKVNIFKQLNTIFTKYFW